MGGHLRKAVEGIVWT